ncbi:MAG: sporulation protein SpoOM [Flavobacterium sp.]|nr:MAG: sporulation protein SpoOM [Flavobacterium sp.]
MIQKLSLIFLFIFSLTMFAQSEATYTVTFTSNWSNGTHPSNNFPANAHWSKLVGATHNNEVVFLKMGELASPGIEDVSELGSNTLFFSEINTAINNGYSNLLIDGDDLPTPLGDIIINNVITTEEFPLLTLITMIAPSPDWIMGVGSLSLLDEDGEWIDEITMDLYPYDAGTDDGTDYNSSNQNTNPQEVISSLQGVAPFSSEIIGTLTITLENVVLGNNNNQLTENITIYPNPTSNFITISTKENTISAIEIYNVLGKEILKVNTTNSNQLKIDLSDLSSGIYLIKIIDSSGKSTLKKVVKR